MDYQPNIPDFNKIIDWTVLTDTLQTMATKIQRLEIEVKELKDASQADT